MQELIFDTLSNIIVKCVNFKVRINGAAALAVPVKREHYGRFYLNVWSALSVALYQANLLTDFNEYNHRDNLLDQVTVFGLFWSANSRISAPIFSIFEAN